MQAKQAIDAVQAALLIPTNVRAPRIGPVTRAAFERLATLKPDDEFDTKVTNTAIIESPAWDISSRGIALVKHFESLFLEAYLDPVGIWTIGYGHTGLQHKDGTVRKGRTITEAQAEQLLNYDMNQFEARVLALVDVTLNHDQFDALVSFDFNTGALHKSTLLRLLNDGDYEGAAAQFVKWNRGGGKVLRGLTRRRLSERNLFNGVKDYIVAA